MYDRRKFAKGLFASVPVTATGLAWLAQNATGQQPAPGTAPARPPAGKGQMDGSPLGDPLPGQKWRVHDRNRPQPRKVTPGLPMAIQLPPSDAIVFEAPLQSANDPQIQVAGVIVDTSGILENGFAGAYGPIGRVTFFENSLIGRPVWCKGTLKGGVVIWNSIGISR